MAMKQALPIAGLGAGMMQGLELHRRHQREDEDVAMRRDQMDMNRESHALNMDTGRLNLDFARETNPLRRQGMEQGVELGALQLEDTRDALPYSRRQRRRQDDLGVIQLDQAQKQQASHVAVNALRMNDWAGFNTAMDQLFPGRMVFMPGDNGEIFAEETDEEGNSEIFTFQPDELMRNITLMGSPQASAQNAMDQGAYVDEVDPVLGAGQRHRDTGQFTQMQMGGKKPKGGAGGTAANAVLKDGYSRIEKHYGKLDETGQIILDGSAKFNVTEAFQRYENLINAGVPPASALTTAVVSVSGQMPDSVIQEMAESEAIEKGLKPGKKGGEYEAFVRSRVSELVELGRAEAMEQYAQVTGQDPRRGLSGISYPYPQGGGDTGQRGQAGLTSVDGGTAPGYQAPVAPALSVPTPPPAPSATSAPAPAPAAAPAPASQLSTVSSKEDFDALPSGATFISAHDGKTYKKP